MEKDLQVQPLNDYEWRIDQLIDKYFADKGVVKDNISLEEKKLLVKELALANKKSEIVKKLNASRAEKNLPALEPNFDIFYYAREYENLIEDISLTYARNLAKKYRFANRIVRIGKLNDLAENLLERIQQREEEFGALVDLEKEHNNSVKLFVQLLNSIDDQMGKLKLTRIDINVGETDKKPPTNADDVKTFIEGAIRKRLGQLPAAVEANFTEITDHEKCGFGEEWTSHTHCQFFNEPCKVQSGDMKICPHFVNKVLLSNPEYLTRRFIKDKLSVRQIAEIAGCKEVDDKVIEYVRGKLRDFGISRDTRRDSSSELRAVPSGEVGNIERGESG